MEGARWGREQLLPSCCHKCSSGNRSQKKYSALLAAGGNWTPWKAAVDNIGLLTSFIMDCSSGLDLDVLTLFQHGIGKYLPRWLTEKCEDCPPTSKSAENLARAQARTVGWLPWLCMCSVQGRAWKGYSHLAVLSRPRLAQILDFLAMLALQFPLLKPQAVTR